jgi:hypothetical protein
VLIRSAKESDLPAIIEICKSVEENHLTATTIADAEACRAYLTEDYKVWLCFQGEEIVGIGVVDMKEHHIPMLIFKPGQEDYKCDDKIQELLLAWFYASRNEDLTLETDGDSRAEEFFLSRGWIRAGITADGHTRFKMSQAIWEASRIEEEAE